MLVRREIVGKTFKLFSSLGKLDYDIRKELAKRELSEGTLMASEEGKLKLCIVTPTKFPLIGGYENLVYFLSQTLSGKIEVYVVCSELNTLISIPENVITHVLSPVIKIKYIGFMVNSVINQIRFYILARKKRFDVIHAHPSFPSGFTALLAKLLLGIPVICTSHGDDVQIDWEIGYGARRNRIVSWLTKLTLKNVDLHTVVSRCMIGDAIEAGSNPSKIRVVYNGINLDSIPRSYNSQSLKKHGIEAEDFIILFLGRLHPKKCPEDLVKAFPKVVEKVPNAKLVFAGKGKEEMKLEKMVSDLNLKDKVIFAGFVSEDEKWDLLKRCDAFILPSVVEGHPITVIEAMACSKPVIVTNIGPFPEIIRDGETGLLVPLHSPDALANAIVELALDEEKRIKMGKMARRDVEERFDINKIADEYLSIYEELINKKKRRMP